MTPCAATRRNIARRPSYGVSPPPSPLCHHVPSQIRRGLSPVSPLSPLSPVQHLIPSTSLNSSNSCKEKGSAATQRKCPFHPTSTLGAVGEHQPPLEILNDYAAYLRQQIQQGELCIATAQNRASSVNRTLAALRGDLNVRIVSPSQVLGQQRTTVRTRAPDGQDYQNVQRVAQVLAQQQHERVAAIVMLARTTGMRLREAILADLPRLHREAEHLGRINIQDGTKGGRSGASAPRWVIANEEVKAALQLAREASPTGSRNLLSRDETYAVFMQRTVLPARATLHEYGLKGFHELRAAYACKRYEQLTGLATPTNGGHGFRTDRNLDHQARLQISLELGHNRIDVVSAYIGGRS